MTDAIIKIAINNEAIGSNPVHPNHLINIVDTITPAEPNVSAIICKNTPK
jgi:hypothetical protein